MVRQLLKLFHPDKSHVNNVCRVLNIIDYDESQKEELALVHRKVCEYFTRRLTHYMKETKEAIQNG